MADPRVVLLKKSFIRKQRPMRTVEQLELATLEWVRQFHNQRLHAGIDQQALAGIESSDLGQSRAVLATGIHVA